MTKPIDTILEARKSCKAHIEFFEKLLEHLKGTDKALRNRAVWAAWCLHQYINNHLVADVNASIQAYGVKEGESVQ